MVQLIFLLFLAQVSNQKQYKYYQLSHQIRGNKRQMSPLYNLYPAMGVDVE